ncbi:kinase-like domain-containing protein [Mycena rebaudengoi]|nr:kinase-like domain-containing protein [Mycena rebaudengoi]
MAEVVAGFAGAGTTLAAARAATSAGFTGRHDPAHRSELAELDRSLHRYRSASQSGSEISFQEEDNFRKKLNASQESLNKHYRSLNAYKDESWFRLPSKIKKRKAVRKMKRAARDANQGLRECVDNLSDSGPDSDASSISAESGSPPGSALERERIGTWIRDLESEEDTQYNFNMRQAEEEESEEDDQYIHQAEEDEEREEQPASPIYSSLPHKRYIVLRKLEQGPRSTVWLAQEQPSRGSVALRISQAGNFNHILMNREIKTLQQLHTPSNADSPDSHPGKSRFLDLLDHFEHYDHNGLHLAHRQAGVPLRLVKQVAKQLLLGLDYMHRSRGIVHTNLEPANILISLPYHESTSTIDDSDITIKIVGLGSAAEITKPSYTPPLSFIYTTRAPPYRCPEIILGSKSLGGWCRYMECRFATGQETRKDSHRIAQMIDLLGDFPKHVRDAGHRTSMFFDSDGRFWYLDGRKPRPLSMESVLRDKYLFPTSDAQTMSQFLLPMLELDPLSRMAAKELVNHEWLRDVPDAALPIDAEHQPDATKPAVPDSCPDA